MVWTLNFHFALVQSAGARLATDAKGNQVILFAEQWACDFFTNRNTAIQLSALPLESAAELAG